MDYRFRIYNEFRNIYTRATEITNKIYNIKPDTAPMQYVPDSKKWCNYKNTVKLIHAIINIMRTDRLLHPDKLPQLKDRIKEYCKKGFPACLKNIRGSTGYSAQKDAVGTILEGLIPPGDKCIVDYEGKVKKSTPYQEKVIQNDLTGFEESLKFKE